MKRLSLYGYLAALKPFPAIRRRIAKVARGKGWIVGLKSNSNLEALANAVFSVENDREHKFGHRDPAVEAMRCLRNRIYDDLRWNETRPARAASAT